MIDDKFINLMEKYFVQTLTESEQKEFENMLEDNSTYKQEFEEQKKVKEVLNMIRFKNPEPEVWENYWMNVYNKFERGLAWLAVSAGALIVFGWAAYQAAEKIIQDAETPGLIKLGVAALVFGSLILLFSVLREKLFVKKSDKYKEVKR